MLDILKVLFIFIFILFLLRRKIFIGYAFLISSILFLLFYKVDLISLPKVILNAVTSHTFINLFFSLTLIKSFENALRHTGLMVKMTEFSQRFVNNKKISIISMPLVIGMLPSLGGAYLSAPMVDSSTKNTSMSQEEKAFINYWYRHPWELVLPLYPGIVLAAAVSGIPLGNLILYNLPVFVLFFIAGFFFSMRGIISEKSDKSCIEKTGNFISFFPLISVLLTVIILKIDLSLALLINIFLLSIWFRLGIRDTFSILKYGFTKDVFLLVLGVIIFKELLQHSGAVGGVSNATTNLGIPPTFVFIFLPFIVGLITGISVGFVGSTFPLLMHIKNMTTDEISLAFVSGYVGVLLSPLHLCLILTRDYFRADMTGLYRRIIPATVIVFISALIEFAILIYHR